MVGPLVWGPVRTHCALRCAPRPCDAQVPPARSERRGASAFGLRCTVGSLVWGSAPAHRAPRCAQQPCDAQ
eukprot:2594181-Pyramimonas_sp.AAC.1